MKKTSQQHIHFYHAIIWCQVNTKRQTSLGDQLPKPQSMHCATEPGLPHLLDNKQEHMPPCKARLGLVQLKKIFLRF